MTTPVATTVAFATEADFITWHDARCAEHNIPFPGYSGDSETPAFDQQWTVAFAQPVVYDGVLTITVSSDEVAADPVLAALEVFTVVMDPATGRPAHEVRVVPLEEFAKPIPPQWMDPTNRVTYDTATGARI